MYQERAIEPQEKTNGGNKPVITQQLHHFTLVFLIVAVVVWEVSFGLHGTKFWSSSEKRI